MDATEELTAEWTRAESRPEVIYTWAGVALRRASSVESHVSKRPRSASSPRISSSGGVVQSVILPPRRLAAVP